MPRAGRHLRRGARRLLPVALDDAVEADIVFERVRPNQVVVVRVRRAAANQMRLFLHIGAYWLMWSLRTAMPRRSLWRVAQFNTLRLRLIKLAARVEVLKRKLRLYLPRSTPNQPIFACALTRLSRMLT